MKVDRLMNKNNKIMEEFRSSHSYQHVYDLSQTLIVQKNLLYSFSIQVNGQLIFLLSGKHNLPVHTDGRFEGPKISLEWLKIEVHSLAETIKIRICFNPTYLCLSIMGLRKWLQELKKPKESEINV